MGKKKKSGAPPAAKPTREERRILAAWESDAHRSFLECDQALELEEGTTKRTIDANRQRQKQLNRSNGKRNSE